MLDQWCLDNNRRMQVYRERFQNIAEVWLEKIPERGPVIQEQGRDMAKFPKLPMFKGINARLPPMEP